MRFLTRPEVRERFEGKTVAIVGGGPSSVDNPYGFVDGHEVVVRTNNYKIMGGTGERTDVFYSFFGASIRKTAAELKRDGVTFCMCKCPDAHVLESEWHRKNRKMTGVDYRWIYQHRAKWWFCDTYLPTTEEFLSGFYLLNWHVPTTGFAAILDILSFNPKAVYLTGFDFFRSRKHNVNDPWRAKANDDPIKHVPEQERAWLVENIAKHPISVDESMADVMDVPVQSAA